MTNQDANRPQRIKIFIITIVLAVIVFIVGAWLITSAIKSVEKKQSETQNSQQHAQKDENKPSESNNSKNNSNNSSNNNNQNTTNNKNTSNANSPAAQYNTNAANSNTTVAQKSNMPNTGPEELLPTALLVGVASYLFFKNREFKARAAENNA